MASGTCDDALMNPLNSERASYQYAHETAMDYSNDGADVHGESEEYDPGAMAGDDFGPEYEEGDFENEGYGGNDGSDFQGYDERYAPGILETDQYGPEVGEQFAAEGLGDPQGFENEEFEQEDEEYDPDDNAVEGEFEESGGDESDDDEDEDDDEEYDEEDEEGQEEDEEEYQHDSLESLKSLEGLLGDQDNKMESGDGSSKTQLVGGGDAAEIQNSSDVQMTDKDDKTKEPGEEKPPVEGQKKKRKRRKKDEAPAGEKPKRKRKRKEKKEGEDSEKKKADKFARRNIRKIITETALEKDTLDAQAAELERQKRLAEIKKSMLNQQMAVKQEPVEKKSAVKPEKDSQLKSLLQAAEEEAEKQEDLKKDIKQEEITDTKDIKPVKKDAIEISSGDDDSDVVMVRSEEDDEEEELDEDAAEAEDPNNSGAHINDAFNLKEKDGRVLVNVSHPTADPDIYLPVNIADHIKPHQIGGIRFLYDNLIECINRFKTSSGFGCILAHSMGLGKTIQVIGFIDIFLKYTGAKSVLIIVPINTLANWMAEFNMWVPDKATLEQHNYEGDEIKPRQYVVYNLNDNYKTTPARCKVVDKWQETGGVLLMGYEMYRLLSSKKPHLQKVPKGRKKAGSDVIDVDEVDRDKNLLVGVHAALVNPGPDLIICDEGHRIKNSHAGISQSLKNIKTKRRIVLTGYPLQNNLIEYWCMVDFVRPNFLGTKTEFCNMFERPIMNGQCADSTPQDVRLMRYRAHVLHSLLEGFVQRRGHTVLKAALPPKEEYVFMVQMSDIQKQLYKKFMDSVADAAQNGWVNNNPLKAFSVCCKIWNHPDILFNVMKKANADDNDLDLGDNPETKKKGGRGKAKTADVKIAPTPPVQGQPSSASPAGAQPSPPSAGQMPAPPPVGPQSAPGSLPTVIGPSSRSYEPSVNYDWANEIMKDYQPGLLSSGGKFVLLFNLLQECLAMEDKVLVFSQSLFTLNLIEDFLSREKVPRWDMDEYWCKNKNYFRLDGSTSSTEREKMINAFNEEENNKVWLFLLSTRAGSLGVNLIGANRVIVMDASWNPCHDCQAICRVYRFGQIKPTFIYRLVTENTMERKIYDRQINKQGMSDRVIDELNPQNQFKKEQVENILVYNEREFPPVNFTTAEDDYPDIAMAHVLVNEGRWLTTKPFTHESLLIDRKELKLTMKEKRLAKQSYVMEKRLNVSYSRPSYSQFYPKNAQTPYQGMIRGRSIARPIASVKPMVSTPVPMKPKIISAPQVLKPGVSVHQVLTTTEIVLPGTNTTTDAGKSEPKKIPAGQQVLVIRTPKGVYIRTPDGKIFAVRSKPQPNSSSPLDKLANTGSNIQPGGGGITVIKPTISTSKPLAVVQQNGGGVKMVVPISTSSVTQSKGSLTLTTGTSTASISTTAVLSTVYTQSQKVNSLLQSGAQIRIVKPNIDVKPSIPPLSALQTLTTATKVVSNGPNFSGGSLISKKILPKPVASVQLIKKTVSVEPKMNTSVSANSSDGSTKATDSSSWNLKPINITALKNPLQTQLYGSSVQSNINADIKKIKVPGSQPVKADLMQEPESETRPTFGLPESPSESSSSSQSPKAPPFTPPSYQGPGTSQPKTGTSLPMRPSDIDLHELQLSGESKTMSQRPSDIDLSAMQLGSKKKERKPRAKSSRVTKSAKKSSSQNMEALLSSSQSVPQNLGRNEGGEQSIFQGQGQYQGMLPGNQLPGSQFKDNSSSQNSMQSDFAGGMGSNAETQNMGSMGSDTGAQAMETGSGGSGGFMRMMSNDDPQDDDSLLAEFNSNLQNNSSFLSELNLTEADQNFMSQHVYDNSQSTSNNSMNSQMNNFNPNMGMPGFGSGGMGYQQPNMNFDMFGNSQNTGYNFPNFGAGPYPTSTYMGNQSGSQGMQHSNSYPGFPMPGMMQPGMYGYPYPPYPYPPMMPPMPYYPPMPMPPNYGQGAGNVPQMNMPMSGDNQANSGNSGPRNNNNL